MNACLDCSKPCEKKTARRCNACQQVRVRQNRQAYDAKVMQEDPEGQKAYRAAMYRQRVPIKSCKCGTPLTHNNAKSCMACAPKRVRQHRLQHRAAYRRKADARKSQAPSHCQEDSGQRT